MNNQMIRVTNARVNNLKNVSVDIPKNKLVVITGLSGSGKSSLAFDTIYAEGQRRYAESLSAYARQFMDMQDKPDVDEIQGLSPTIAIDQKNYTQNPRSTVGTATEIYDYLRLLFARIGTQYSPVTGKPIVHYTVGQITEEIRKITRHSSRLLIVSPLLKQQMIKPKMLIKQIEQTNCRIVRVNGIEMDVVQLSHMKFDPTKMYDVDIVTTVITDSKKQQLHTAIDKAIDLSNGYVIAVDTDEGEEHAFATIPIDPETGEKYETVEPRSFSFNSPHGACPRCSGLGRVLDVDPELVIPNPRLTLAEGAIQPWTRIVGNHQHYQRLLEIVAEEHGFRTDMPIEQMSQKIMDVILFGTDGQEYTLDGKIIHFEGVIPNLTQRHAETNSDYIRKEIEHYMRERVCSVCHGKRLKKSALAVKIGEYSIADMVEMSVEEAHDFFLLLIPTTKKKTAADKKPTIELTENQLLISTPLLKEINKRLENLIRVGLSYLALDRSLNTISGGEAQRVRLSTQLSAGLTGVIYILDEPSIGLHPKDTKKMIDTLTALRDVGNSVIVVEHDQAIMEAADYIIDVGPGAGTYGGEILATGTPAQIKKNKHSLTGQYLSGEEEIPMPKKPRKGNGKAITITGAKAFNLRNVDVSIPLGMLVCVTGVSGSGKTTLVHHILSRALSKHFYRAKQEPGEYKKIAGLSHINKVISIDQTPIGRTPRSNPATYTGIFTAIRDLFADQQESKLRSYDAGTFSFNVKGAGRCEACAGEGYVRIPMQFLTDVFVECNECEGKRYNKETLEIHYRTKNIADVLKMTVEEAYQFFADVPALAEKLHILRDVGLGYLQLGQPATTLSGGEAQRVKLATELSRKATGKTLYILDEPTSGLHFADIKRLLNVLNKLVDKGNTVLIIEHNMDVIKSADWIIDLGPDGGKYGGNIVGTGVPKDVAKMKDSWTGKFLKETMHG